MAAEGGATALYCNMERPASGSAVNMLRSRRRGGGSAGRRRSGGAADGAVPSAAMGMEGGATLGSQVVANARRELASAYLPPSGMQGAPPRQIHSAASGSSWGAINTERNRLMDLVLERLVDLRFGGPLPAGGARSNSPLGQEDEVVEFLDVVLGRLNLVPGERPPPSRGSSRGKGGSPKSRRIAAAAVAAAAAEAAGDDDAVKHSAAARAKSAVQDPAARIVEVEAELGRWKRECQQQRAQKQKLAAERVELANRLADVQFALKQHEHEGLDHGLDSGAAVGQHDDEDARRKLATVSQQLQEAQQVIRQLQQQNQQLRESKAAAAAETQPEDADQDADSSIEDLEMEQLLSAARDARRAAEISQEGRLHEQSLTQHLAAARIQRRYREQSGRRVLREVRQAAAGTVQSAWARPATAPGRPTGRPLTPEHHTRRQMGVGQVATATDEGAPAAAPRNQMGMGGLPNAGQQAKIDADMAWLAAMGMPVSQVEYATGNRESEDPM
jgi:hypothetical protein